MACHQQKKCIQPTFTHQTPRSTHPKNQNTACRGFNICHQKECAGGTPENRCDLKTFSGEPTYYPDQTATSGDGYMSQYVISRN